VNYWDPKKCLKFFQKFARRIFSSKPSVGQSLLAKIRRLFVTYFADGQYNAANLEKTLQEAFGSRILFNSPKSRPSGMKIAITTATISNATLCIFSNYNGIGSKKDLGKSDKGY
jgi:hypothetical protein